MTTQYMSNDFSTSLAADAQTLLDVNTLFISWRLQRLLRERKRDVERRSNDRVMMKLAEVSGRSQITCVTAANKNADMFTSS